jgi:ATP-dependent DNA ligase
MLFGRQLPVAADIRRPRRMRLHLKPTIPKRYICLRPRGRRRGTGKPSAQNQAVPMPYFPRGSIMPSLPRAAAVPPAGPGWVHEVKHDGFRILARRSETGVRLYTRNGYCFADRFNKIVAAIESLPVTSCIIDGEAIVVDANGLSVFDMLRNRRHDGVAVMCAFDLIEVDGIDMRWATLEERKTKLSMLLTAPHDGIARLF